MADIICIAGPTASGKTALAVELAKALGGQVISCDSMQVYRRMDIGTAKPTPAEMQGIPHYMLDVAEPEEDFSVSRYCAMATPILEDLLSRNIPAIVAGGTGLYMDALIRGNAFAPAPSTGRREELEQRADREGIEPMLSWLQEIDPETAARLHPGDRKRILRALENYLETGETMTAHNRKTQQVPPRFQASGWACAMKTARISTTASTAGWKIWSNRDFWRKSGGSWLPGSRKAPRPCRPSAIKSFWTCWTDGRNFPRRLPRCSSPPGATPSGR